MPEVLDWPRDNPDDLAKHSASQLRLGRLVVVPTDTLYAVVAHGMNVAAVAQLARLTADPIAVVVPDPKRVADWLPSLGKLGLRLTRHCWPGPLILQSETGSCPNLPPEVQAHLLRDGFLNTCCPGHAAVRQIAAHLEGPLLLSEMPEGVQLENILARAGEEPALILNDGPTHFGRPASVVRVQGNTWTMNRPGVLSDAALAELATCRILFVCTGNTCRSPLAMALCRQLLAQRLGCGSAELPQRGFQVLSAGLAAIIGEEASPEAVEVVREMGGCLEKHASQPLTLDLLMQADCLFTMTQGHLRMLQGLNLTVGPAPEMLSPRSEDVTDPIGSDIENYRHCARQILACLEERLPQLLEK